PTYNGVEARRRDQGAHGWLPGGPSGSSVVHTVEMQRATIHAILSPPGMLPAAWPGLVPGYIRAPVTTLDSAPRTQAVPEQLSSRRLSPPDLLYRATIEPRTFARGCRSGAVRLTNRVLHHHPTGLPPAGAALTSGRDCPLPDVCPLLPGVCLSRCAICPVLMTGL